MRLYLFRKDFLDVFFQGNYFSIGLIVDWNIKAYNSSNTLLSTSTDRLFAFDSYSYFEEQNFNLDNISN